MPSRSRKGSSGDAVCKINPLDYTASPIRKLEEHCLYSAGAVQVGWSHRNLILSRPAVLQEGKKEALKSDIYLICITTPS